MAPSLEPARRAMIKHLIKADPFKDEDKAEAAGCNRRTITRIRSKMHRSDSTTAAHKQPGRRPTITPHMKDALLSRLDKRPDLTLKEIEDFL